MANFGGVVYRDVYPGVDLSFHADGHRQVEYDFTLAPAASASAIRLEVQGAKTLNLDAAGNLVATTASGATLTENAPTVYQDTPGGRQPVTASFALLGGDAVGFRVGAYDPTRPLVIDPVVAFSTYAGGAGNDEGNAVTVDLNQNILIAGQTVSSGYPVTSTAYQTTLHGGSDAFVTKLDPTGTTALFSTYLGGSSSDTIEAGLAIATDPGGVPVVVGVTSASDYPTTGGAVQTIFGGGSTDGFVTVLNPNGQALAWSTFLGGSGNEQVQGVSVIGVLPVQSNDGGGSGGFGASFAQFSIPSSVWVTGWTTSNNFPTQVPLQGGSGGGQDAFITGYNSGGNALLYSSYLGGSGSDAGTGLVTSATDTIYVTGSTTSGDYPVIGGWQSSSGGGQDAFVTSMGNNGTAYVYGYSTYLGGGGTDAGNAITVDSNDNVFVTGVTSSTNLPVSAGAYQPVLVGGTDAFVAKFNSAGANSYLTYLGGTGNDAGSGIGVTASGQAVVGGTTASVDFPTVNGTQALLAGASDAFVDKLNAAGTAAVSATYWGGTGADQANGLALEPNGDAVLVGTTVSTDFPITAAAFQTTLGGGSDAFVTRLALPPMPPAYLPNLNTGLLSTAPGAGGGDPMTLAVSDAGVRYADGTVVVDAVDLSSAGFGTPWGQTRSWSNGPGYASHGLNGNGWIDEQLPYLLEQNHTNTLAVISGAANAEYFDLSGGAYQVRYFSPDRLVHTGGANEFLLTDSTGAQLRFWDFSDSLPWRQRGQFKSYTDPYGNVTSVTARNADGTPAEVQRSGNGVVESYLYSYLSIGINAGWLSGVVLRRKVGSGPWATVRQVSYTYYDGTTTYGNAGDLQTATIGDAANTTLDTWYYRYYMAGQSNGSVGGLKYAFSPDGYRRLVAAYGNPLTLPDSQVAAYADDAVQYDANQRVSQITVAGAGASANGGLGTYSYLYTPSSNAAGTNSWQMKTTETLPDGTTDTVFTNCAGEVMLQAVSTGGQTWNTFAAFDPLGRLNLTAQPSAVTGYDSTKADLLNKVGGNYQYLSDASGRIDGTDYSGAGYELDTKVQQGELGTAILTSSQSYTTHSGDEGPITVVASTTAYPNADGSGSQSTTYAYTWSGTSDGVLSETTTSPTVTAGQNGPGTADTSTTVFDTFGNDVWDKDGGGFLRYTAYDTATGAVTATIDDVNTANSSDFTNLPSGWVTPVGGGLNLLTQDVVDALGRTTRQTDAAGNVSYTVYNDPNHESLRYDGWNSNTNTPTGPTQVTRADLGGSYTETLTMSATPHLTGGAPDGTEAVSGLQSLARTYVNAGGQDVRSDAYVNLSGVVYGTGNYLGTQNSNYYTTTDAYDTGGRLNRVGHPTGTVDKKVFDGLGRVSSTSVGTADFNQTTLTADVYDAGLVGDGNLTQETVSPGSSQPARVTQNYFDWRDRPVIQEQGVGGSVVPLTYSELDNEGRTVATDLYDASGGISVTSTNGVPNQPSASLLRGKRVENYDNQGRDYLTQEYDVNPTTGALSTSTLNSNTYFDQRGEVIETRAAGGEVAKTAHDGAGRVSVVYTTDGAGGTSWAAASSVSGDNVLQQVETARDGDGNPILVTTRQRFHDQTARGALGTPSSGVLARVSYAAAYYDAGNRVTATVDVGSNGGSAYMRPATVPGRSDTVLVTSEGYDAAGYMQTETDPAGLVTQTYRDNLGQVTKTIEDYTNGTPTTNTNKTTEYTHDTDGNTLTVKVDLPGGTSETTQFVYGVSTMGGSGVNSNDILAATEYPDPSTGSPSTSQQATYTVDALGDRLTMTDRDGTTHSYSYNALGEVTSDAVTRLGSGVDGAVRRRDTAYNVEGQAYLFTSYNAATGGGVVNQVQDVFNGLGQTTGEYQAHSGVINTSTTPEVQYAFAEMAGGANNSRLVSMTYPNGRVIRYNYNTGVDASISRLSSISDASATLESYAYLGDATVVKRMHPQTGVDLTFVTAGGSGDGGDQYTGLDRFGRVVDQKWVNTSTSTTTDEFQYGYDRDSNVLYADNRVNSGFGELYSYDTENQLASFQRGTLNSTKTGLTGSASASQSFTPDALGNFTNVTTNGTGQSRTNNLLNQVTVVGANSLAYDGNGNLTTDQNGNTLKYDAWSDLVQARAGSTVLDGYGVDALGRRITENPNTQRDLYFSTNWQVLEERVAGAAIDQNVWSAVYVDGMVERDRDPTGGGILSERLYAQRASTGM